MSFLQPSSKPSWLSFGHLPVGVTRLDLTGRLFGTPNLLKRLQARDILDALKLQPAERVLDFGCSSGYMTVEMAKLAREAVGIDVNPHVSGIVIPERLKGRLRFLQASGSALPFEDHEFDVVLASEVLPMVPDPAEFMTQIRRVLKPGGRLVIVNGVGLETIRQAYLNQDPRLAALKQRYGIQVPDSYEDYCERFQRIAGTARKAFLTEQEILSLAERFGFRVDLTRHSPRLVAGAWIAWHQFELFVRTGKVVPVQGFLLNFLYLSARSLSDDADYPSGLIVAATRT